LFEQAGATPQQQEAIKQKELVAVATNLDVYEAHVAPTLGPHKNKQGEKKGNPHKKLQPDSKTAKKKPTNRHKGLCLALNKKERKRSKSK